MKSIKSILVSLLMLLSLSVQAGPINLNEADASSLQQALSGVGKVRAEAIVEYREKHGPFEFVDDILKVDGIGRMTLEQNRENIVLR